MRTLPSFPTNISLISLHDKTILCAAPENAEIMRTLPSSHKYFTYTVQVKRINQPTRAVRVGSFSAVSNCRLTAAKIEAEKNGRKTDKDGSIFCLRQLSPVTQQAVACVGKTERRAGSWRIKLVTCNFQITLYLSHMHTIFMQLKECASCVMCVVFIFAFTFCFFHSEITSYSWCIFDWKENIQLHSN